MNKIEKRFKVNVGYRRNRYFSTLENASTYCQIVLERSGVVLSIVEC